MYFCKLLIEFIYKSGLWLFPRSTTVEYLLHSAISWVSHLFSKLFKTFTRSNILTYVSRSDRLKVFMWQKKQPGMKTWFPFSGIEKTPINSCGKSISPPVQRFAQRDSRTGLVLSKFSKNIFHILFQTISRQPSIVTSRQALPPTPWVNSEASGETTDYIVHYTGDLHVRSSRIRLQERRYINQRPYF
jgi:hypothetical protein